MLEVVYLYGTLGIYKAGCNSLFLHRYVRKKLIRITIRQRQNQAGKAPT